jgi:hypothetical protein
MMKCEDHPAQKNMMEEQSYEMEDVQNLSLLINSNNPIKHPGKFHSITFAYSNIQC